MDKKKFSELVTEMKNLTSDFYFAETYEIKDLATKMIVATASELLNAAGATPKKSEMPCNCLEKSKTLQEVIDEAKAELTDGKTFAAIVFRVD